MLFTEFQELLAPYYLYIKIAHIVTFTAWMAGLFYLPRLYVYHTQVRPDSDTAQIFKVMERKLLRGIMNPAMIGTYVFGVSLSLIPGVVEWGSSWWHIKLTAVFWLSAFHGFLSYQRKRFFDGYYDHSENFYRIINEIPTIILIVIVSTIILR